MVWQAAEPFISHRPAGNQRPQPDWWDDECYQQLVSRNAAWRKWRRERTTNAREAFCRKRLQFHHLVRRKKVAFWSSWLRMQEGLSRSNPRAAARNVRAQLAPGRHGLPRSMRSPDESGGRVEGEQCLNAWRDHFRDVPSSLLSRPQSDVQNTSFVSPAPGDVMARVALLRRNMSSMAGPLDFPFTAAELQHVLSQLPSHRAPGPDGRLMSCFRFRT